MDNNTFANKRKSNSGTPAFGMDFILGVFSRPIVLMVYVGILLSGWLAPVALSSQWKSSVFTEFLFYTCPFLSIAAVLYLEAALGGDLVLWRYAFVRWLAINKKQDTEILEWTLLCGKRALQEQKFKLARKMFLETESLFGKAELIRSTEYVQMRCSLAAACLWLCRFDEALEHFTYLNQILPSLDDLETRQLISICFELITTVQAMLMAAGKMKEADQLVMTFRGRKHLSFSNA